MSIKITPSPHGRWEYVPVGGHVLASDAMEDLRMVLDSFGFNQVTPEVIQAIEAAERLNRALFPATEPADEETKAHCMCVTPDWYHDGLDSDIGGRLCRRCRLRQNIPYRDLASSSVVPAPTETGPWQRIEDVPANVTVLDCDGLSWSYVDSHWRCHEDVDGPYSLRLINDLAPFVAAEEG